MEIVQTGNVLKWDFYPWSEKPSRYAVFLNGAKVQDSQLSACAAPTAAGELDIFGLAAYERLDSYPQDIYRQYARLEWTGTAERYWIDGLDIWTADNSLLVPPGTYRVTPEGGTPSEYVTVTSLSILEKPVVSYASGVLSMSGAPCYRVWVNGELAAHTASGTLALPAAETFSVEVQGCSGNVSSYAARLTVGISGVAPGLITVRSARKSGDYAVLDMEYGESVPSGIVALGVSGVFAPALQVSIPYASRVAIAGKDAATGPYTFVDVPQAAAYLDAPLVTVKET